MNVGETLKHIGTYWEIYEYIGNHRKKLTDIKKYLMKECGKPESTARMQITNFRYSRHSIFALYNNDKVVGLDIAKINELEREIDKVSHFTDYDYSTTILIYGAILSRSILSQKNGWIDKEGRVYTRYTASQLEEDIGKGISTVKASLKELEEVDLIERKRMGLTMTNIYVKVPSDSLLGQNSNAISQNPNPFSQKAGVSVAGKPDPSKYKRVNKETYHKEYVVREGESF